MIEAETDDEKELLETYRKLSKSGKNDSFAHVNTVLKAEAGLKKQYGIEDNAPEGRKTA